MAHSSHSYGTPSPYYACDTPSSTRPVRASWLRRSADAVKPWQYQSWIFIRDPDFAAKATRVLDLYARTHNGVPLGPDEYVLSSDEKPSIQARRRCHPTLPPAAARTMRINHEYDRGGALAYLAAYDVHRAHVYSRCSAKTGIVPFMTLVEQVMTQEPYASARRVFWIVECATVALLLPNGGWGLLRSGYLLVSTRPTSLPH